jgi:hypothetical protein
MLWRQSTPASKQGTSSAATIVSKSIRQFRQGWLKLPRVINASTEMKRRAWRDFSANMAAHLSWEVLRSLRHRRLVQASKNLFALLGLGPFVLLQLLRYKTSWFSGGRLLDQRLDRFDWHRAKAGQR